MTLFRDMTCGAILVMFVAPAAQAALTTVADGGAVYDDSTGLSWYRDVSTFSNTSYDDIVSIVLPALNAGTGYENYGVIWSIASQADVDTLVSNNGAEAVGEHFPPTQFTPDVWIKGWSSSVNTAPDPDTQYVPALRDDSPWAYFSASIQRYPDTAYQDIGAWLTTTGTPQGVPEPSSLALAGIALAGMYSLRRRERTGGDSRDATSGRLTV